MPVSEQTYTQVALEDVEGSWELVCGQLRRKPAMTQEHNSIARRLGYALQRQLPIDDFEVAVNTGRVRIPGGSHFVPDVMVIPSAASAGLRGRPAIEAYDDPLPLVVEVWSPSTGEYDVDTKLPEYRRRGDLEIWRIHPYERTLTAWTRAAGGSYTERTVTGGEVRPVALPGVVVLLESLFR
jgi:Uma2 family endonuclease